MPPEYFGHVTLKFGSQAWWVVEAQLFDGSREGNCTSRGADQRM